MAKTKTVADALNEFAKDMKDALNILLENVAKASGEEADDEEEDDEAPAKGKKTASKKTKKEDEDDDDEEDDEDDEEEKPAKGKSKKASKEADDEDEDEESEVEYKDVQKAVATAGKAYGRAFVADTLKKIGGKKCDHAEKLKPEQYAEFIEALEEGDDE